MVEYSISKFPTHVTLAVLAITVLMSTTPCHSQLNLLDTVLGLLGQRSPDPPPPAPSPPSNPPAAPAPPEISTPTTTLPPTTTSIRTTTKKIKKDKQKKVTTTPPPDSSSSSEEQPESEEIIVTPKPKGRGFTADDNHTPNTTSSHKHGHNHNDQKTDSGSSSSSGSSSESDEEDTDVKSKVAAPALSAPSNPQPVASSPEKFIPEEPTNRPDPRPLIGSGRLGRKRRSIFWPYMAIAVAH